VMVGGRTLDLIFELCPQAKQALKASKQAAAQGYPGKSLLQPASARMLHLNYSAAPRGSKHDVTWQNLMQRRWFKLYYLYYHLLRISSVKPSVLADNLPVKRKRCCARTSQQTYQHSETMRLLAPYWKKCLRHWKPCSAAGSHID